MKRVYVMMQYDYESNQYVGSFVINVYNNKELANEYLKEKALQYPKYGYNVDVYDNFIEIYNDREMKRIGYAESALVQY